MKMVLFSIFILERLKKKNADVNGWKLMVKILKHLLPVVISCFMTLEILSFYWLSTYLKKDNGMKYFILPLDYEVYKSLVYEFKR